MIFLTSLLRHLRLVNQRQLSFCSHIFISDKHSAAGYEGSVGDTSQAGLNLVHSFRGLFCVHARESRRRKQASWVRSAFQGAVTPLTWAAHVASAKAVADIAGEQKSNLPGVVFCTGCLDTWRFHIVQYQTISLQCKDKTLWSQARGKVFMSISMRMEFPLCPDPGLEALGQVYLPERTCRSLPSSPCYPSCSGARTSALFSMWHNRNSLVSL